MLSEYPIRN